MFAVIRTGGKQYSVKTEDRIRVEKLAGEPGDMIELSEVLMVGDTVGTPLVDGALVTAEIVDQARARKVIAFKKRRRQNSRRTIGHRQHYTELLISEILTGGAKPSKKASGAGKAKQAAKAAAMAGAAATAATPTASDAKGQANEASRHLDTGKDDAKPAPKAKKEAKPSAPAGEGDAVFQAPAGEPDDLKKISGVGPVLEKKLNDLGVTQFAQVAAFTKEDIVKLDDALSFKGRIERDDWVGQAAKLAKGE